jgi:acyl-coenzyme A thioesterase PaaI-like protein
MDRWLGDGGMPIIEVVGGSFTAYGVDGEDLGWVAGEVTPTEMGCNPHGIMQAGVHSLLLDASMNFAINAALPGKARTRGTLEMKTETMRPAVKGTAYALRGEVVRLAKQVAYGEATVRDAEGVRHRDLSSVSTRTRTHDLNSNGSYDPAAASASSAAGPRRQPSPSVSPAVWPTSG